MAVNQNNLLTGGATVNLGASDRGAIKEGIAVTPSREVLTLDLEQELTASRGWNMSEKFNIEFTLCEPTLVNVKHAWDTDNTVAAGPPATLAFGDHQFVPQSGALIVTGKRPGATDGIRTLTFLSVIMENPAPLVFSKRQESNLKATFMGLFVSGLYVGQFSDAA